MNKLVLLACIAFVLYSCGKTPQITPDSGISATLDGVNENFNFIDSVGYSNGPGMYSMTVSGKNGTSDTSDMIQLNVFSQGAITAGTYTLSPESHQAPFYPLIIYSKKGSHDLANEYVADYTGNHPLSITINVLTKNRVQGTFSGTLVIAAGSSGATKAITGGQFNLGVK
jgi:hypothetical protein